MTSSSSFKTANQLAVTYEKDMYRERAPGIVGCLTSSNRHGFLVRRRRTRNYCTRETLSRTLLLFNVASKNAFTPGNAVACNDNVALVYPDFDRETEETIADFLQVKLSAWRSRTTSSSGFVVQSRIREVMIATIEYLILVCVAVWAIFRAVGHLLSVRYIASTHSCEQ